MENYALSRCRLGSVRIQIGRNQALQAIVSLLQLRNFDMVARKELEPVSK